MLSPSGRARPFDADADGYVRGEGCGVLVLRRQQDAVDAYAMISGTAVYQHGDRGCITQISASGQSRVIRLALRAAGVAPHEVQYVEAQANGVRLATVIEAETLADAYRPSGSDGPPLMLGSAKANLGYLETVSGMASLMKAVLAVWYREIPPQAGLEIPDPDIAWDKLSLAVPRQVTAWPDAPRRVAGVSAFGFTGTYCHALVEAFPGGIAQRPARPAVTGTGRAYWPESHRWS
jgi:acyl transferase domain-containing protein